LKRRFGGNAQADKYRIEIRNRRRKTEESLQSLHVDIRRLAALAFPSLDHQTRETISCDYFLDALADPDFALKVRERHPEDLDSALRIALQLEVWTKEVDRLRGEKMQEKSEMKKTREVTKTEVAPFARANEALEKEVVDQKKRIAVLEARMAKHSIQELPDEEKAAEVDKKSFACWGCGEPGHLLRTCPKKTAEEKRQFYKAYSSREAMRDVRPIQDKQVRTCIVVKFRHYCINALVDTGSDITIAGSDFARRYSWKVHPHPVKTVKLANGECMIIHGVAKVTLYVRDRKVDSEILITPDLIGLIIGIDWLAKQGEFVWDFRYQRIKFEDGGWMQLHKEDENAHVRRLHVAEDTVLLPSQQTEVPVRVTHRTRRDEARIGMIENNEVPSLRHVYSARSLIPAKFSGIKVPLLNADYRSQVIREGTKLEVLHEAQVIDKVTETVKKKEDLSPPEALAIEKIMKQLPDEVTEEQREKVKSLLKEY